MKKRCYYKNHHNYRSYGKKGIKVCLKWMDSKKFISWAINNGWEKGLQIDRINNKGNYEPSNCQFITPQENLKKMIENIEISCTGVRHVYPNGNNYKVVKWINGKNRYFGTYKTLEEAKIIANTCGEEYAKV